MPTPPTITKPLNQQQLDILLALYKFRFATSASLIRYLKLPQNTNLNSRLNILVSRGYIGKTYDSSFKLLGKPASYHLLTKSFKTLREFEDISPKVLNNIRRDNGAADRFRVHNLALLSAHNTLEATYDQRFSLFTASDLNSAEYEYFPRPLPDGFISLATSTHRQAKYRNYFLFLMDDSLPFFVTIQKILGYLDPETQKRWKIATGESNLPPILIICETPALQNRLHKRLREIVQKFKHPPAFATVSRSDFDNLRAGDEAIWRTVSLNRVLVDLYGIVPLARTKTGSKVLGLLSQLYE